MPEEETLGFLELVSNLASRALAINSLKSENTSERDRISSGEYTIFSLDKALNALKSQKNRQDLLAMAVDVVTEMIKVEESLLVMWNEKLWGYVPLDYRINGIKTPFEPSILPSNVVSHDSETQAFDLATREFSELLKCPWPEMANMKLVFPIWNNGRMEGFIAITSDASNLKSGDKISALKIIALFTAYAMRNFA
jgi:hypothetical protein